MHAARRLRLQVGACFTAIAVAFVGVNVVVFLAVVPQVNRLDHINGDLTERLQLLSQLRGTAASLRTIAVGAALRGLQGDRGAAEAAALDLVSQLARLQRLADAYAPLVEESDEGERWATIREREIPAVATRAAGIIEDVRAGGPVSVDAVEELRARSARVDELFAELVRVNAEGVLRGAQRIDASLKRLLLACALLLGIGTIGAILLLLRSLSLVRDYSTVMDTRLSELDAFAARVAHDLRSPLQTISLSLGRIAPRIEDDGLRATAERAQGGVRRMTAMITGLLEFARSGAAPEPGESAELPAVFEGLRDELQASAERAGVRLSLDSEPDLEVAASPVAIHAIVANLVENAIKYMRDDGERKVAASARAHGRRVHIDVRDTGIGIPADRLSTIFDAFVRVGERRDSYGLGLATVKRLVDAHSGSVRVQSEEGEGTVFTVDLPRAIAARSQVESGRA